MKYLLSGILLILSCQLTAQSLQSTKDTNDIFRNNFASPILTITLKQPVTPPTPAQATQRLLWYKGKKVNDSILVTPQNTLVLYSKKRDLAVVQPDKRKDPSAKIISELSKTSQKKEKLFRDLAKYKINTMWYPAVINTLNEFDHVMKTLEQLLKNTVSLPPSLTSTATLRKNGSYASNTEFILLNITEEIKRAHAEVMSMMKNYPSINFTAPPAKELASCLNCTESDRQLAQNKIEQWRNKDFWAYESQLINKAILVIRSLTDLKGDETDAAKMHDDMYKAMEFGVKRMKNKSDILIRDHGKDIHRLFAVMQTVIAVERQKELLGFGEDSFESTMLKLFALFENFDSYFEKQMDERNYDFVFNLPFILSIERQRQLLSGTGDNTPDYIQKFNDYNRFKIDLEVDFEGKFSGCAGGSEKMHAESKEDHYVALALINCKYQFVPAEVEIKDHKNVHFGYTHVYNLKITSGTWKTSHENDNGDCVVETGNYTGLEFRPYAPIARFTFCEDEQDSIQFHDLHLPYSREETKGASVFRFTDLIYQDDMNRSGVFPDYIQKASLELEDVKKLIDQYQMGDHPDTLSESEMRQMYELANRRKELIRILNEWEDTKKKTLIFFDARNKEEVLLNETAVIPYSNDTMGEDVKFTIKIKVTHDPIKKSK